MSDDNDDLDAFARLFGAAPETPPEGVVSPTDAWTAVPAAPAAPAAPAPADPLGWLLSAPAPVAFATGDPITSTLIEPTQALPTRRSLAAEAARASRHARRRDLVILGSIGGLVLLLVVVLILVLIAKYGSSGSPDALLNSSSEGMTPATATVSPTPSG
ncbi:MAG TPA: hypothetical protein VFQ74_01200 [Pseudolysinimonas sp.]|nr:hypothetical protein [Pseudolysinimonas sp.]